MSNLPLILGGAADRELEQVGADVQTQLPGDRQRA
jgi:hypothetical protein